MSNDTTFYHMHNYQHSKEIIDKRIENIEEILDVKQDLKNRRVNGFKFNYSLQEVAQNCICFAMFISIDETYQYVTITNRKPVDLANQDAFHMDHDEMERQKKIEYQVA